MESTGGEIPDVVLHISEAADSVHSEVLHTPDTAAGDLNHSTGQDLSEKVKAFSDALRNIIPIRLIPNDLAKVLRQNSNYRLELARQQGIALDRIFIGADCLPTWDTLCWDPEHESLHSVIQTRLLNHGVAKELGNFIQHEIRSKSSRKLQEAQTQGINIKNISIGRTLLPEWNADDNGRGHQDAPISIPDDASSDSWVDEAGENLETTVTSLNDITQPLSPKPSAPEDPTFCNALAPDSIYDSDYEDEDDDIDEIYMNNYVSAEPVYDEYGHSNIVHDIEIVGGSHQYSDADLEVYLAVDDEEYEDLPEVELAIDKEAFEYHFGDQDAVDIYIPDAEIFCFDGIEEEHDDDDEMDDDNDNDGHLPLEVDSYSIELDEDDAEGENNEVDEPNAMEYHHNASGSETYSEEE